MWVGGLDWLGELVYTFYSLLWVSLLAQLVHCAPLIYYSAVIKAAAKPLDLGRAHLCYTPDLLYVAVIIPPITHVGQLLEQTEFPMLERLERRSERSEHLSSMASIQ